MKRGPATNTRLVVRLTYYGVHIQFLFSLGCGPPFYFFLKTVKTMKSLNNYSLNIPEKDYHALDAWSYSVIARYAKDGFSAISTLHDPVKQTDSMRFGSLFDCMLTRGKQVMDEYEVMEMSVPDAEKNVLDILATITADEFNKIPDEVMQKAIALAGYQSRWKYDTQYAHIQPYASYYDALRSGKTIVSKSEWDDALKMYYTVTRDEYLKDHFKHDNSNDKEYIYQAQFVIPFATEHHGDVKMKIMPDMLEVDHKNKTIQPWDVKTSACPAYDFAEQFIRFRYDIQASVYTDVLQEVIENTEEYKDYTILPYLFMDISRSDMVPVTYEYDPRSISQQDGLSYESKGRTYQYKNYRELLDEILTYEEEEAKVPSFIATKKPNDLISLLNK